MKDEEHAPLGIVSLGTDITGHVEIRSYSAIYAAIGVTSKRLSEWQSRYGLDSLGVGENGELLAPGFPILSKVAWMFIDPVDLSDSESRDLITECEKAILRAEDSEAREELAQIRTLALTALERRAVIRFGHP